MRTTYPLPVMSSTDLQETLEELDKHGTSVVVGSMVDMAGVAHVKAVPAAGVTSFHRSGVGAAPSWNAFCVDNEIAFTPDLGVVGDLRLRIDLAALTFLDNATAWAAVEMFDQYGEPAAGCARGRLRKVQADAESQGVSVLVGTEVEFALLADGLTVSDWQGYGSRAFFQHRSFLVDLERAFDAAGLSPEQLHAEYGLGQFEVSFAPADPLAAADTCVLARLIISEVGRKHGVQVSFSPLPAADLAGNGAHLHMSLARDGQPLLSGGSGPHGMTDDGAAALAGIVTGLPETLAIFAGSILSPYRLQPGRWSGAHACWGLKNREAAVRFCAATPGNPHGANIELKCVDTSANPYLAIATMLGLALEGMKSATPLPPEVDCDPATLPAGTVPALASTQADSLERLRASAQARAILGDAIVDATLAVRSHEIATLGERDLPGLCDRLRYCWSS